MQNPEIKKEYDRLEPTFSIIQAFIDSRKASGLTQKELSNTYRNYQSKRKAPIFRSGDISELSDKSSHGY